MQGHPSHVHHERRLHKLMLQDELRDYEAEQVRHSTATSCLTLPEQRGDSGSLRTSRDGGASWWGGGWGTLNNSMNGAAGAARAADLMRTLGALGDPSNPWQVRGPLAPASCRAAAGMFEPLRM